MVLITIQGPGGHWVNLSEDDLVESFVRSDGPGGQNVNKVSTAVQLRFNAAGCTGLSPSIRSRLLALAGSRATQEGEIVILAREHRTREANRVAALERLKALIQQAMVVPKKRRPTRPTLASKRRRLEGKQHRSGIKKNRSGRIDID
ncbi:MAG: alternative ribosome rescue aminoacyl-tRNA hydrolase ArfB [Rhodospirillaceae bacterium]